MNLEYFKLPVELMGKAVDKLDVRNPQTYGNYLAQTFYYVSHSTRLLAFAAGLMKRHDEPHFRRFIKHISEETSHEILAEQDLGDLGMRTQDFLHLPETRMLWESQYYKIQHESPLTLMGYIIALEAFAALYLPKFYEKIQKYYHGKAIRFIRLHAEEDPDHIEKAIQLTAQLSPELQEIIGINVVQTAKSYVNMVNACEASLNWIWTPSMPSSFVQEFGNLN